MNLGKIRQVCKLNSKFFYEKSNINMMNISQIGYSLSDNGIKRRKLGIINKKSYDYSLTESTFYHPLAKKHSPSDCD
jgi:hypothetical protein